MTGLRSHKSILSNASGGQKVSMSCDFDSSRVEIDQICQNVGFWSRSVVFLTEYGVGLGPSRSCFFIYKGVCVA